MSGFGFFLKISTMSLYKLGRYGLNYQLLLFRVHLKYWSMYEHMREMGENVKMKVLVGSNAINKIIMLRW